MDEDFVNRRNEVYVFLVDEGEFGMGVFKDIVYSVGFFVYVYRDDYGTDGPDSEVLNYGVNMVVGDRGNSVAVSYAVGEKEVGGLIDLFSELLVGKNLTPLRLSPLERGIIRIKNYIDIIRLKMGTVFEKLEDAAVFDLIIIGRNAADDVGEVDFVVDVFW